MNTAETLQSEATMAHTLQVGDTIRVIDLSTDRAYRGTVAALWPKERAISVDVRKGKRIYFRSSYMDQWYLPDLDTNPEQTTDVDLSALLG